MPESSSEVRDREEASSSEVRDREKQSILLRRGTFALIEPDARSGIATWKAQTTLGDGSHAEKDGFATPSQAFVWIERQFERGSVIMA